MATVFFRTMSFILLGTESKHEDMRGIVCDFMQNNDAEFFQISTCRNYVDLANMRRNGVWATEVEVFGAATLFNTPVYVFLREAADRQPRWLKYEPLFEAHSGRSQTDRAIYIMNLSQHFQPVFSVAH